jgi:predicted ribosomally synthesized peptide with SipW-like signal peptide
LIAGIVLGLGTTTTLAAWTDDVFANGAVTTGHFTIQGDPVYGAGIINPDTDFQDHPTPEEAGLMNCRDIFKAGLDTSRGVVPGASAFCSTRLRLGKTPENDNAPRLPAELSLVGAQIDTGNALANALRYTVRQVIDPAAGRAKCRDDQWDNLDVIPGFPVDAPLTTGSDPLQPLVMPADNGADTRSGYTIVCFKIDVPVDAPAAALGIDSGPILWHFDAIPIPAAE